MTVVLTSSLLVLAYGCGPDVNVETDWAIGEYSNVRRVVPSIEASDGFGISRFIVREEGVGTYMAERCGTVEQTQDFEWRSESDDLVRFVPKDGAEAFDNLVNTSFLLYRATGCAEAGEALVAIYFVEWLNNGDFEGGTQQPVYRTNPCATPIAAPSPCPDGIECGPGTCELSWCDDEAPEPCEFDD